MNTLNQHPRPHLRWSRYLLIPFLLLTGFTATGQTDDIEIVRQRLLDDAMSRNPSTNNITEYISSQQEDGSWANIDYADTSVATWAPMRHLSHLRDMAVAYRKAGHAYYEDPTLLAAIEKGIEFWLVRDPRSENWWYNDLGSNQTMAPFLLVIQGALDDELFQQAKDQIIPRVIGNAQNRVWYSELVIQRGVMERNRDLILDGVEGIAGTIEITLDQGIQADGSFHQHDEQLYNGGYGYDYLSNVITWWELLGGTEFVISGAASEAISSLVLDGFGWMVRYGIIDYSAIGRFIARGATGSSRLRSTLDILIASGDGHKTEYQALLDHITAKNSNYPYIEGHKHFWRSDYSVNRRADFMVSLRMFSVRTIGGEIATEENLQGFFLPFGATFIYRDGNEYNDIMPVWDWYKIPGVTVENPPTGQPPGNPWKGKTWFVGGVSNGRYGMSTFEQLDTRVDVSCLKSWFFFDQGFAALAADIRIDTDFPAFTSVNQCLLRGNGQGSPGLVYVSDGGDPRDMPMGEHSLADTSWVYHDGVGYIFPDKPEVYLRMGTQTGNWHSIREAASSSQVSKEVFLLGLDHGTGYDIPREYYYCVLPVGDMDQVAGFAENNPIEILSNTKDLQAMRHAEEHVTGISFFIPGALELEPGVTIRTDSRCLVLISEGESGLSDLEISIANPMATFLSEEQEIRLRISGSYSGPGATFDPATGETELLYVLPGTHYSGSSITQIYTRNDISSGLLVGEWGRMRFSWVYGLSDTWGYSYYMGYVYTPFYPAVYSPITGWMYHYWNNGSEHLFYSWDQGWILVNESNGGWYYSFQDEVSNGTWSIFQNP